MTQQSRAVSRLGRRQGIGKNFGKNPGNMGVGWGSNLLICNPACPAIPPSLWFESNRAYQVLSKNLVNANKNKPPTGGFFVFACCR